MHEPPLVLLAPSEGKAAGGGLGRIEGCAWIGMQENESGGMKLLLEVP